MGANNHETDSSGTSENAKYESVRGGVTRSVCTVEHMLKTAMFGLVIYEHLPKSLRRDQPTGYKEALEFGLMHHDVSKVIENGWTDALLLGSKHPTRYEWFCVIRLHPEQAASEVEEIAMQHFGNPETAQIIAGLIRFHHERYDGITFTDINPETGGRKPDYGGYPGELEGEEICLGGRIGKVSDTLSAMAEKRNYRSQEANAKSMQQIVREIKDRSGTEYCPEVARALERVPIEILIETQSAKIWPDEVVARLRKSMAN